jgi:hypothetical protein
MPRRNRPPTTEPERLILRGEADRLLMLQIVNLFESWRGCYRACRRAKACASPHVKCFDHNIEIVRKVLDDLANWRRLDGRASAPSWSNRSTSCSIDAHRAPKREARRR